jgi:hypothetical protein
MLPYLDNEFLLVNRRIQTSKYSTLIGLKNNNIFMPTQNPIMLNIEKSSFLALSLLLVFENSHKLTKP